MEQLVHPREVARRINEADKKRGRWSGILHLEDVGVIMGTKAFHGHAGDISRAEHSFVAFHTETDEVYVGRFIAASMCVGVRFPKSGCRFLTEEEVERLERSVMGERVAVPLAETKNLHLGPRGELL